MSSPLKGKSMSKPEGNFRKLLTCGVFALLLIVGSLALAACGGSSSSSSSSGSEESTEAAAETEETSEEGESEAEEAGGAMVAEAEEAVAELEAEPAVELPGPPIKNVASVKGKRVFWVANGLEVPFNQEILDALEEAGKEAGLTIEVGDSKGSSATATKLIDQAVGQGVDVIIDEAQTLESISAAVKGAKEAGIPVIMGYQGDPEPVTPQQEEEGMVAGVTECYSCAGEAMANFVVADSGGKADAVLYSVPENGVAVVEQEGFEKVFEEKCPECKLKVTALGFAEWANAQSVVSSSLKSDPGVNYLIPVYDGVETYMEAGIVSAPNASEIKVVSLNASLAQMEKLAKGEIVAAEAGFNLKQTGYAFIDQALRVLTGTEPSSDSKIALRLFTENNIGEIDLKKDESTWYGEDIVPLFQKLWGIS